MPYITSWERRGAKLGRIEGRREGQLETVLRQLSRKLGGLNVELIAHIELLPPTLLNELAESLFDFSQLEDLETWLYGKTGPQWFTYRSRAYGRKAW